MSAQEQEEQDEIQKRQLAHYSAAATAWFNTRLEHDKSLLTLSSAGIGLLVSVVAKAVGTRKSDLILYELALTAFILCLATVLWIYRQNSRHLEDVIQNHATEDAVLGILDPIAICTFAAGILLSSWLGYRIASHSSESPKETTPMATKDGEGTKGHVIGDSFNRAINIRPTDPMSKSFNGAAKIVPTSSAPKPVATTPANTSTPPANTQPKRP